MLKKTPQNLSPELYTILYEMGHGDELVIVDANFPARSNAARYYANAAMDSVQMLDLITQYLPLDTFVPSPAFLMSVVPGDNYEPELWPKYKEILRQHEGGEVMLTYLDREAFYAQSRKAYAIISTGERFRYGNIILKKGIVEPERK